MTTEPDTVQRVALIFAQHGDHFFDNDGPSDASWDDFSPREQLVATAAARAAIEAMMEPSPQMVLEGAETIAWVDAEGHNDAPLYDDFEDIVQADFREKAERSFVAMIAASLKGEGE